MSKLSGEKFLFVFYKQALRSQHTPVKAIFTMHVQLKSHGDVFFFFLWIKTLCRLDLKDENQTRAFISSYLHLKQTINLDDIVCLN